MTGGYRRRSISIVSLTSVITLLLSPRLSMDSLAQLGTSPIKGATNDS